MNIEDRMRTARRKRKIQAVLNSVEAELDDPESEYHDLNPKNRAKFLMKVKIEMTGDAEKEGVILSNQDLSPFNNKITEYLREYKKIKENTKKVEEEEAVIKAKKTKKAREKRERRRARQELKRQSDAVTKISTAERGRQARTLKKIMKQSNKLSHLMGENMDIPYDEDLPYFDESGQLTERQKQLADKIAHVKKEEKKTVKGGKRKTCRKRNKKTKRRKTKKIRRKRTRKKRGRGKLAPKTKVKKTKAKVIPSIRKIHKPISGAKANLTRRKSPLRRQSALKMFKSKINTKKAPVGLSNMSELQQALPQEETVLEIPSSGSDESDADDEIQKIMNSDNE